jgi:hypothetical protein
MSEVKVNKISPRSGTTVTLGDSGDTFTIPSGATINNQGTATNFGATGSASWTTTVKTGDFTAVAGEGYFVNTTSGEVTVTLPSSPSAGSVVALKDYANTFDTNPVTINRNSEPIGGETANKRLTTEGIAVTLIYIDSTKGWLVTDDGLQSNLSGLTYSADFLVIAGGGGGGGDPAGHQGGGGGAGGYRNSYASESSGGGGSSETSLTLSTGTVYTITIGAGGAGLNAPNSVSDNGVASSITGSDITDITTVGGGGGGIGQRANPGVTGSSGGSGGGGANSTSSGGTAGGGGGSGTANQGFAGGSAHAYDSDPTLQSGGGGGAGGTGGNGTSTTAGGSGPGLNSAITGSTVARAGGGVGGTFNNNAGTVNLAGTPEGSDAPANSGSGGGSDDGNGGSGVVILRVATANYSGTTTGSPTVTTDGSDKVIVFNASGSYTG